jgi:hypothetical protein
LLPRLTRRLETRDLLPLELLDLRPTFIVYKEPTVPSRSTIPDTSLETTTGILIAVPTKVTTEVVTDNVIMNEDGVATMGLCPQLLYIELGIRHQ